MRPFLLTTVLPTTLLFAALSAPGHAVQTPPPPTITDTSVHGMPTPDIVAMENGCALLPLQQQLQTAEVRRELPQYEETNYRNQLLRFTTSFYARLAQDLLRGEGEYLTSLHRLMGSDSDSCTASYRALLLSHGNARDFAFALWQLRQQEKPEATEQASVHATTDNGAVLLVK